MGQDRHHAGRVECDQPALLARTLGGGLHPGAVGIRPARRASSVISSVHASVASSTALENSVERRPISIRLATKSCARLPFQRDARHFKILKRQRQGAALILRQSLRVDGL
jgi:hypothetical protein